MGPFGRFSVTRFPHLQRMVFAGLHAMPEGPAPQQCHPMHPAMMRGRNQCRRFGGGGASHSWGSQDWKQQFKERKEMMEKAMKEKKMSKGDWVQMMKQGRGGFGGFGGNFNCGFGFGGGNSSEPAMDVKRTGDEIQVHLEVPGVSKSDLSVELNGTELTITGKRESSQTQGDLEKEGWVVKERNWASFTRTVQVPEGCRPENVTSKMGDGVLNIVVKLPTSVASHKIEIQ